MSLEEYSKEDLLSDSVYKPDADLEQRNCEKNMPDGRKRAGSGEAVGYINSLVSDTQNKSIDKWIEMSKAEINAATTKWLVNRVFYAELRSVRGLMAKQARRAIDIEKQAKDYLRNTEPYSDGEKRLCWNMVGLIPERRRELDYLRRDVKKALEQVAKEQRDVLSRQARLARQ